MKSSSRGAARSPTIVEARVISTESKSNKSPDKPEEINKNSKKRKPLSGGYYSAPAPAIVTKKTPPARTAHAPLDADSDTSSEDESDDESSDSSPRRSPLPGAQKGSQSRHSTTTTATPVTDEDATNKSRTNVVTGVITKASGAHIAPPKQTSHTHSPHAKQQQLAHLIRCFQVHRLSL